MSEVVAWGAVLRFLQALIQSAPTILIGLIVAGVFRRLLGREKTLQVFGGNTWRSLPQAWLVGMLLPVCSLGVIPIMREMRRCGISGGTILAFGLTAPLFNPISVLYGLTLSKPIVILTFSFCSLLIVTVVGASWDRLFSRTSTSDDEVATVPHGIKRIMAIGTFSARELTSPVMVYILIGLAGVGMLSVILPNGSLQSAAGHDDAYAPLFMCGVAIPAYATPMTAMVQLASMFQHGNSVGAAFALLALGAGANLGLIAWMFCNYGVRKSVVWFSILVGIVLMLSYGIDKPLYPKGIDAVGHTHAFDIYCAPFHSTIRNPANEVFTKINEEISPDEIVGLSLMGVFLLVGICLRILDRKERLEGWLEKTPERQSRLDVVIPGPVLGGVALVGLILLSILGCYLYYPPPEEIFAEMRIANTEAVASAYSKNWESAEHWIPIYDDWTRKLQVSVVLRGGELSDFHRMKARILRERLDQLKHAVEDRNDDEAYRLGSAVTKAFHRMRVAYVNQDQL